MVYSAGPFQVRLCLARVVVHVGALQRTAVEFVVLIAQQRRDGRVVEGARLESVCTA